METNNMNNQNRGQQNGHVNGVKNMSKGKKALFIVLGALGVAALGIGIGKIVKKRRAAKEEPAQPAPAAEAK